MMLPARPMMADIYRGFVSAAVCIECGESVKATCDEARDRRIAAHNADRHGA